MKKNWIFITTGLLAIIFLFIITRYYRQDIFANLIIDQSALLQSQLDNRLSTLHLDSNRLYIIVFWALWSEKSEQELFFLQLLRNRFGPELEVIAINTDFEDLQKEVKNFLSQKSFSFLHLRDQRGELVNKLKISGVPSTLIYRPGKIGIYLEQHRSLHSLEVLEKVLPKYLN